MQDWQTRVLEEHAELQTKTDALFRFLNEPNCPVSGRAKEQLAHQYCAMWLYLDILRQRIEDFGREDGVPLRDTIAALGQD